jgi:ribosomal protein S27AE
MTGAEIWTAIDSRVRILRAAGADEETAARQATAEVESRHVKPDRLPRHDENLRKCPECGGTVIQSYGTRRVCGAILRFRECSCGHRFVLREKIV